MKRLSILFCLFCVFSLSAAKNPFQAIVITPVADLVGQSHKCSPQKHLSLEEYYHNMPFSGSGNTCLRIHQLLFNERVTVLEERGPEVKIKISNFYYVRHNESGLHDTYWTLKKNLLYLDGKNPKKIDSSKFPPPISYQKKTSRNCCEEKVVTLKKPFYDPITQTTYSAGTRFLAHPDQNFTGSFDQGYFNVYIFNAKKNELVNTHIPKLHCIRNYFTKPEDQVRNFVQVLRSWTYQKNGFIPYVLGGFSWTRNCQQDHYETKTEPGSNHTFFHRKEWPLTSKQGFDCVGIIGRAAQICDIPFFYKNTLTLNRELESLKAGEKIREGDLITYPGHVMVVSNLEKNLIVEARGYDHSRGKVHEVPLSDVFSEIKTYSDLVKYYREKKPVSILDIQGQVFMVTKNYKILKIHSVWNRL